MPQRKAVVFCSASYDIDPKYNEAAREVVRALHAYGWALVRVKSFARCTRMDGPSFPAAVSAGRWG